MLTQPPMPPGVQPAGFTRGECHLPWAVLALQPGRRAPVTAPPGSVLTGRSQLPRGCALDLTDLGSGWPWRERAGPQRGGGGSCQLTGAQPLGVLLVLLLLLLPPGQLLHLMKRGPQGQGRCSRHRDGAVRTGGIGSLAVTRQGATPEEQRPSPTGHSPGLFASPTWKGSWLGSSGVSAGTRGSLANRTCCLCCNSHT